MENSTYTRLRELGWTEQRALDLKNDLTNDKRPARVISMHRGAWVVEDGTGERRAKLSGKLRYRSTPEQVPAVGDWVAISGTPNVGSSARIESVAPRTSALIRAEPERPARGQVLAANVDLVLLGAALPRGVNLRRLERGVALSWESGAVPVVVLTKADLSDDVEATIAAVSTRLTGVDVIALSTLSGMGVHQCAERLRPGETAVLLGPSGVGKSTLLNALLGSDHMRTSEVRSDGKGRHTTTHRELFRLPNGAMMIDTPGLRELQLWGVEEGVDATFEEVALLAQSCRFADCRHASEPGCAVLDAIRRGTLDADRLTHWRQLRAEQAYLVTRDDARAQAELKRRGAAGAKALRSHIKSKYR